MSVQYQKEIFSNGRLSLFLNYSGINPEDIVDKEQLSLSIFAIDRKTYKQVFSETLNCDQARSLYQHLNNISIIRDGTEKSEFVELTSDLKQTLELIEKVDGSLLESILSKIQGEEKLSLLLDVLTENEIQNLHASIRQANHKKALVNLTKLLELEQSTTITDSIKNHPELHEYLAGQPEKIFQNWIEKNIWTLGIDYIKKHSARKIGINSEADIILESTDGFIDLIELKRPKFNLLDYDRSHDSYYPSKELSKVLGQSMQYLKTLEDFKLNLEKINRFKLLRPRIKIIIGRTDNFNDNQLEALRLLNSTLHDIQIISYDYLYLGANNIISYYDQQTSKAKDNTNDNLFPSMS